jgi:hypothetical protein
LQRLAEQRRHDPVGLGEGVRHNRLDVAQAAHHVGILRPLAGVQERHLGRRPVPAMNPLRAERLPHRRLVGGQSFQSLAALVRQFGGVAVVDSHALRGAQIGFERRRNRWCPARLGGLLDGAQTLGQGVI